MTRPCLCTSLVCLAACSGDTNDATPGTSTTSTSPSTSFGTQTSANDTTTTSDETTTGEVCSFLCPDDHDVPPWLECDAWAQDCPLGEKCTFGSRDGLAGYRRWHCVPVAPQPAGLGETCTMIDPPFSGLDDCERHALCWDVDPNSGTGTCIGLCRGAEHRWLCEDPRASCFIDSSGWTPVCLPSCDPLAQDCGDRGCYPHSNRGFACAPDASGAAGAAGDPCESTNTCDAGTFCAPAHHVLGCEGQYACCSAFCDLRAADPDAACLVPDQYCLPWYEPGGAPPWLEHVGMCTRPR